MAGTVHKLGVGDVEPEEAAGDPDVIAQLEWMLERAKLGEITAFSCVIRDGDTIGTVQRGQWRGQFFEAVGVIQVLLIDRVNGSKMTDEPGREPDDA